MPFLIFYHNLLFEHVNLDVNSKYMCLEFSNATLRKKKIQNNDTQLLGLGCDWIRIRVDDRRRQAKRLTCGLDIFCFPFRFIFTSLWLVWTMETTRNCWKRDSHMPWIFFVVLLVFFLIMFLLVYFHIIVDLWLLVSTETN